MTLGALSKQIWKSEHSEYYKRKFELFWACLIQDPSLKTLSEEIQNLKSPNYPKEPQTLSEHILKKRLDLKLSQKIVASKLKVSQTILGVWENNRGKPDFKTYPAIMGFLGYCPYEKPKTWTERLILARKHLGLSHYEMAHRMEVNPAGLSKAMKTKTPSAYYRKKFEKYMRCV